ncbi:MAG: hypothetical protein JSV91_02215 [Phycisphaerales bacterium]|nr:MAG: hypothetical protein JSV91_02215 [Phycisphaerales bacterium]
MIRDLIERWLIWWELDRSSHPAARNEERGGESGPHRRLRSPIDHVLPPGRLPRLFTFLAEMDQRLTEEAPTARHVPSPQLRRRTLEALRQSAVTSADATPRRWSTALASLVLCAAVIVVAVSVPQRTVTTRPEPRPAIRPARLLMPNLSASLKPDFEFITTPLIKEARLIVDDLNQSARHLRSVVPLVGSGPEETEEAAAAPGPQS